MFSTHCSVIGWRSLAGCLLLGALAARADALKLGNVTVATRDAKTATVVFDIAWEDSWRHGSFHDAAWVFFKVQADEKSPWQPVRLTADRAVNPTGYSSGKGTPLEFVVPAGNDGFVGMFVRRAAAGRGLVAARGVTAVWDLASSGGVKPAPEQVRVRAFGIEMVYVAEGPYYLGSAGSERNRFYRMPVDDPARPSTQRQVLDQVLSEDAGTPYPVTGAGAIPTGRRKGQLWAAGMTPEDGGEIPASFPNGYAAFYCMKRPYVTAGQYAAFLNTLTAAQVKARYHAGVHGRAIARAGEAPNAVYTAANPNGKSSGLSWADGAGYAAWAGLRPMTELEYEKAVRGPRVCGPNDASPSFWGLADVNIGGHYERPVSAGSAVGRAFAGTHGRGTPIPPPDWPTDASGIVFRGGYGIRGADEHLRTAGRRDAMDVFADRCDHPYGCWRVARSVPAGDTAAGGPVGLRPLQSRIPRLDRPFRANGVLGEWGKPALTLSGPADLLPVYRRFAPFNYYGRLLKPWQGPGDLSARVYLGWDGEALCLAAEVTDDAHLNTKTRGSISSGDALKIGLVTAKGVHWDLGLALTKTGVAFHQWQGKGDALAKTVGCAVTRDDKARVTRYELRLPLAALGLEPGTEFGFNVVIFDDDDGNESLYWLQLAPGLTPSVNTALYPRFVLEK